jgi:hypothetical protein
MRTPQRTLTLITGLATAIGGLAVITPPASADTALVGWATQGGGTTGGGSATATTVNTSAALTSAASATRCTCSTTSTEMRASAPAFRGDGVGTRVSALWGARVQ